MTPNGTAQESSLLLTLAEISKLVAHCHDPGETLANIVNLIQGRFHTDVCSVYLFEPAQGELVLGATVGLRPESIGRVRMRVDEGLTGLVAQELAPVMVEDAFRHPRFKYFPEAGEDPYHSFLGVPLVEGGVLQGVLVVQTVEPRPFSSNEVRMLVTVASQLAPLISGAQLLERLLTVGHDRGSSSLVPTEPGPPSFLRGVSLSPGRGQGEVYVVNFPGELLPSQRNGVTDPAQECSRLNQAMTAAAEEITRLSQRVSDLIGQDNGAILQAQLLMLQDRTIEHDLTDCLKAGQTAEEALHHTLDKYVALFQGTITGYLQERIQDVKDVFRRIHWHLRPRPAASSAGRRLVLIGPEASVMDLFSVDLDNLAAVVVESGGVHSHAAILARSLGIPMVGQVPGALRHLQTGQKLDVDGSAGMVYLDPPAEAGVLPPVTNGERPGPEAQTSEVFSLGGPHLEANINLLSEVQQAIA
jgi:phosphotransferase system enzyme I (PtsP)